MNLFARSLLVLALLFGIVFAVGAGVLYYYHFPLIWALGFTVGIVLLQFALGPMLIDIIFKIDWHAPAEIAPEFDEFLRGLCKKRRLPIPRLGIIEDGNPNAFTYGHIPSNARLVVTRGLMQMLSKDEFEAVVAHEIGHIRHYDFIVMTVASLAPALLYMIYRWMGRQRRGGGPALAVAIGAFICYYISQYVVLFLSRIRDYFADEHASISVKDPNAIATALVKIAYGLARIQDPGQAAQGAKARQPALNKAQLMGSLGICSFSSSTPMALYSTTAAGQFSMDHMLKAMQWDLWNPWARWFELQSTHPLVARRVRATSWTAKRLGVDATFPMTPPPKQIPWSTFAMDLTFLSLPWAGIALGILFGFGHDIRAPGNTLFGSEVVSRWALVPLLAGIGWLLRLAYSYGKQFRRATVVDLVGELEVSHIRCIPVELEGEIIGRGIPGLFWSKDLVLQDETGFITLIYRQPLGLLETLFGLLKAERLVGKKGRIRGWYRRGPIPYIELSRAEFDGGQSVHCVYNDYLWVLAILTTVAGILMATVRL